MTATRADVARAAGVSPALVSYVLNGGPRRVSPQARERVLSAVAELGYRPNQIARALRASRTRSIGMLMPDHTNPHFAELAQHVENEAFARDHVLILATTDNDSSRELAYLRAFVDRQVDGLLLISATADPDVAMLTDAGIAVVLLDRVPPGTGISSVLADNRRMAEAAVRHLLEHGRRDPACISGLQEMDGVKQRVLGWRTVLQEAGSTAEPVLVRAEFSREGGYAAMQQLLARGQRPDAVFVVSDAQAIGALRACLDAGVEVPRDLALVSFDGTQAGRYLSPSLTSVDQVVPELAAAALEVLLAQIEGGGTEHRVLEPRLQVGESCGCRPGTPGDQAASSIRPARSR